MAIRMTKEKLDLIQNLIQHYNTTTLTRQQIVAFVQSNDPEQKLPRWIFNNKEFRVGRAEYDLQKVLNAGQTVTSETETKTEDPVVVTTETTTI